MRTRPSLSELQGLALLLLVGKHEVQSVITGIAARIRAGLVTRVYGCEGAPYPYRVYLQDMPRY